MKYLLLLLVLSCSQQNSVVNNTYEITCTTVRGGLFSIDRCNNKEVICYTTGNHGIWCMQRVVINE